MQLVALTVGWLGLLMAIDYTKNPHLWAANRAPAAVRPSGLALWVNHLCCTGCLGEVRDALARIPWVDAHQIRAREAVRTREQAESAGPAGDYGGWIDVGLTDVTKVDFVEIDRALRDRGMVASRMEFGGPQHFRLEARVRHMCCGMCKDALSRISTLERARLGRLRWVDSVTADRAGQKVIVHARYQDPGQAVDVADLLGAFDEVGLPALSLHVLADAEPQPRVPGASVGR
ncbi:MAG: hypothetical protein DMF78_13805 [Acidobacteria bacterium]|nr:MAG: hypothetical protein DMF78_13805 [Acidobacteriota bacterium]